MWQLKVWRLPRARSPAAQGASRGKAGLRTGHGEGGPQARRHPAERQGGGAGAGGRQRGAPGAGMAWVCAVLLRGRPARVLQPCRRRSAPATSSGPSQGSTLPRSDMPASAQALPAWRAQGPQPPPPAQVRKDLEAAQRTSEDLVRQRGTLEARLETSRAAKGSSVRLPQAPAARSAQYGRHRGLGGRAGCTRGQSAEARRAGGCDAGQDQAAGAVLRQRPPALRGHACVCGCGGG